MSRLHHTRWSLVALLIAGVIGMSSACAQPSSGYGPGTGRGPGMGPGMGRNMLGFDAFDRNGDGRISETEFQQTRAERQRQRSQQGYPMRGAADAPSFSALDADGDGSIDPAELDSYRNQRRQSWRGIDQPRQ